MKTSLLKLLPAVAVSAALGAAPSFAQDDQIILKSTDGSANLSGKLVDFADGFYTVDTDIGRFRVSSARMTCEGAACPEIELGEADVVFAGSDTIGLGLMPLLMTGYANTLGAEVDLRNGSNAGEIYAEVIGDEGFGDTIGEFLVASKSSSAAFPALENKTAHIGMASRRITRAEAKALKAAGAGNMVKASSERVVAVDNIVVIVHPDNPVDTVSISDLAAIYAGQITNWKQLGGADMPIKVYSRSEGSGTRAIFENTVFEETQGNIGSDVTLVPGNNEMASSVNLEPGGIGYVGYAFQRGAKPLNLKNQCGITVSPSTFAAKTEEYPMGLRLYFYSREDNLPDAGREFLNYAMSKNADGVIAKSGFIDLGVEQIKQDFTGTRMQEIIENTTDPFELGLMRELLVEMLQWDRLSTTLRFKSGSSRLDQKALNDVERLITYLETLPLGTEVAVVGFTDSDGAFEANRALSQSRSAEAAQTIQVIGEDRLKNVKFVSKGFGELSPSACNTSAAGKSINRRVEVWVRVPKNS